jgi:hypothetical protein
MYIFFLGLASTSKSPAYEIKMKVIWSLGASMYGVGDVHICLWRK